MGASKKPASYLGSILSSNSVLLCLPLNPPSFPANSLPSPLLRFSILRSPHLSFIVTLQCSASTLRNAFRCSIPEAVSDMSQSALSPLPSPPPASSPPSPSSPSSPCSPPSFNDLPAEVRMLIWAHSMKLTFIDDMWPWIDRRFR